jgi:hypothetical protein
MSASDLLRNSLALAKCTRCVIDSMGRFATRSRYFQQRPEPEWHP